jgi:hypothetical protein
VRARARETSSSTEGRRAAHIFSRVESSQPSQSLTLLTLTLRDAAEFTVGKVLLLVFVFVFVFVSVFAREAGV